MPRGRAYIHTVTHRETRFVMLQELMVEAQTRERVRVSEENRRREFVRRLAVMRRRQRRAEAARRAVQMLSVW
jgi:hypothetical protein